MADIPDSGESKLILVHGPIPALTAWLIVIGTPIAIGVHMHNTHPSWIWLVPWGTGIALFAILFVTAEGIHRFVLLPVFMWIAKLLSRYFD